MNGTVVSKKKKKLNGIESNVLRYVVTTSECTAKDVKRKLCLEDDIPAIRSLSTLRGLDLILSNETTPRLKNKNTMDFEQRGRIYYCPHGTIYRERAIKVLLDGLESIKNGEYGEKLYPFRPLSELQTMGTIEYNQNGVYLKLNRNDILESMASKQVKVLLESV